MLHMNVCKRFNFGFGFWFLGSGFSVWGKVQVEGEVVITSMFAC